MGNKEVFLLIYYVSSFHMLDMRLWNAKSL